MFDAARILVYRRPVGGALVQHFRVAIRAGRLDERVEGVGLAARILAAAGTLHVDELGHVLERRTGARDVNVFGQYDRQVLLGYRHRVTIIAVDDRDRRAPVSLS